MVLERAAWSGASRVGASWAARSLGALAAGPAKQQQQRATPCVLGRHAKRTRPSGALEPPLGACLFIYLFIFILPALLPVPVPMPPLCSFAKRFSGLSRLVVENEQATAGLASERGEGNLQPNKGDWRSCLATATGALNSGKMSAAPTKALQLTIMELFAGANRVMAG